MVSPCTVTVIVLLVSPLAKVTVPLGKVPPKSVAFAGLVVPPVTAHRTAASLDPLPRMMVKVKGLVPLFPSGWSPLVAEIIAPVISSLVMVPITGVVVPILYPVPATSVTITVSLGSIVVSTLGLWLG